MRAQMVLAAWVFSVALVGCSPNPNDGSWGAVTHPFDDPQVMGLAVTIDDDAARVAQAASARVVLPAVRDFAARMIREHRANEEALRAIAQAQSIPIDQTTTEVKALRDDTDQAGGGDIALVEKKSGIMADRQYLGDGEVVHDGEKALAVYDRTLLPNVKSAPLRDQLTFGRQLLESEIAAAQGLLDAVGTTLP